MELDFEGKLISALDRCAFDKAQEFSAVVNQTRVRNGLVKEIPTRNKISIDLNKKTTQKTPEPSTKNTPTRTLEK